MRARHTCGRERNESGVRCGGVGGKRGKGGCEGEVIGGEGEERRKKKKKKKEREEREEKKREKRGKRKKEGEKEGKEEEGEKGERGKRGKRGKTSERNRTGQRGEGGVPRAKPQHSRDIPGRKRERGTSTAQACAKHWIAAPIAVSSWITGTPSATFLFTMMSSPEKPSVASASRTLCRFSQMLLVLKILNCLTDSKSAFCVPCAPQRA